MDVLPQMIPDVVEESNNSHTMSDDTVVLVAADGDAILVVGDELRESKVKLRVTTSFLRHSSEVFDALFGPHFAEGGRLDKQNPPEIVLQDDAMSMALIRACHKVDVAKTLQEWTMMR